RSFGSLIRASVGYDDRFKPAIVLLLKGVEGRPNIFLFVVGGNDHGDHARRRGVFQLTRRFVNWILKLLWLRRGGDRIVNQHLSYLHTAHNLKVSSKTRY